MTFDLSIIFDIPECQYFAALRCLVAFAFKIRNHRALQATLRCKQRCVASKANVAFAFKICNHRALRCFLYLSEYLLQNLLFHWRKNFRGTKHLCEKNEPTPDRFGGGCTVRSAGS